MRALLLASVFTLAVIVSAFADECRDNSFQPTFVRHDSNPRSHYVEVSGAFTPMVSPDAAQATCRARGVRQLINGQDCRQRFWGDFSCGCNITPSSSTTCTRFRASLGLPIP